MILIFFLIAHCCAKVENLQMILTEIGGQKAGSCALVEKRKVMHLGRANEAYMILHSELVFTTQESYPKVSITHSLKALA